MNDESLPSLTGTEYKDVGYRSAVPSHTHSYLMPLLLSLAGELLQEGTRVLDVGCGNGFTAGPLLRSRRRGVGGGARWGGLDGAPGRKTQRRVRYIAPR